jgi:hypothetical protein
MAHVIVANESDMEFGIDLAYEVAISSIGEKELEFSFPSEGLMHIFLNNLYSEFITHSVPLSHGLDLKLNVPTDDEYGDEIEQLE